MLVLAPGCAQKALHAFLSRLPSAYCTGTTQPYLMWSSLLCCDFYSSFIQSLSLLPLCRFVFHHTRAFLSFLSPKLLSLHSFCTTFTCLPHISLRSWKNLSHLQNSVYAILSSGTVPWVAIDDSPCISAFKKSSTSVAGPLVPSVLAFTPHFQHQVVNNGTSTMILHTSMFPHRSNANYLFLAPRTSNTAER